MLWLEREAPGLECPLDIIVQSSTPGPAPTCPCLTVPTSQENTWAANHILLQSVAWVVSLMPISITSLIWSEHKAFCSSIHPEPAWRVSKPTSRAEGQQLPEPLPIHSPNRANPPKERALPIPPGDGVHKNKTSPQYPSNDPTHLPL